MLLGVRQLWREFAMQRDVVGGIMMRELMTKWGRRNLGFAWLFCEPLVFAFPVIAVWSLVRAPYEHGLPMVAFIWSGYMPILIFRHVTGGALGSMRRSRLNTEHRRATLPPAGDAARPVYRPTGYGSAWQFGVGGGVVRGTAHPGRARLA